MRIAVLLLLATACAPGADDAAIEPVPTGEAPDERPTPGQPPGATGPMGDDDIVATDDEGTPPLTGALDGYPTEVTDVLDLPWPRYDMDTPLPAHLAGMAAFDNTPAGNPLTDAGATLGRVLFYDTELSANRSVACASCHLQVDGFSEGVVLSEGFDGGLTGRNSMGLANQRYYASGKAFWDERADSLEEQALMPIQDSVEMGLTLDELEARVADAPYYAPLFGDAFGDDTVTSDRIARALAQFVRAIASVDTRFDDGLAATGNVMADFPGFTDEENRGKDLFFGPQAGCAVCHVQGGPPGVPGGPGGGTTDISGSFLMDRARNNGLDGADAADGGLGDVTGNPADLGLFKSSSLRDVARTGPYMHDGRFDTLLEVVEHYDSGIQDHPTLDPALRGPDGAPRRLGLTPFDRQAIVAFLETLSDRSLASDPRFADPFR